MAGTAASARATVPGRRSETVGLPVPPRGYPVCYKQAKAAIQRQWPENVLPITDNFRSRKPILDFVNQRFAAPLNSIGYEPLVCYRRIQQ